MSEQKHLRQVRSFVRRQGRLTKGQERAIEELWPQFGIEYDEQPLDFNQLFGRSAPVVLEVGFGNGASLVAMAKSMPEKNFIGIEVHRPGIGNILMQIGKEGIQNLRVMCHDAVEVLEKQIPDNSLSQFQLFFPDPWHKKRHHKRRIVQAEFLDLLSRKLTSNGIIHMATDWEDYAIHMMETLSAHPHFSNTQGEGNYAPRPDYRPVTKFEERGHRLGHGVWDLIFTHQ